MWLLTNSQLYIWLILYFYWTTMPLRILKRSKNKTEGKKQKTNCESPLKAFRSSSLSNRHLEDLSREVTLSEMCFKVITSNSRVLDGLAQRRHWRKIQETMTCTSLKPRRKTKIERIKNLGVASLANIVEGLQRISSLKRTGWILKGNVHLERLMGEEKNREKKEDHPKEEEW